jgi:hypothetical protein
LGVFPDPAKPCVDLAVGKTLYSCHVISNSSSITKRPLGMAGEAQQMAEQADATKLRSEAVRWSLRMMISKQRVDIA